MLPRETDKSTVNMSSSLDYFTFRGLESGVKTINSWQKILVYVPCTCVQQVRFNMYVGFICPHLVG